MISTRILRLAESETIAMAQRSRDLKAQGIDVINLSLGEPDFNTPDFIKEAAVAAIAGNVSHYPPVAGFQDVREAITLKFKRDNGLEFSPNQIVVSTGAKQSIINTVLALVNPGDEVLIPAPYWVSYADMVYYAEGTVKTIAATAANGFKITPDELAKGLTPRTKLFIFSSPSNPTGAAYSEAELRALAEVFTRHPKCYVVSDEIYEHIRYEGHHFSIGNVPEIADRVITVNGVSKAFAMTGWRIGYLGAPPEVAKACSKIQSQFTSGANSIAQMAAKAAVLANPNCVEPMREAFRQRRQLMLSGLREINGFECAQPEGAFYLFPDVSALYGKKTPQRTTIENGPQLSDYLLNEAHVATVAGSAFGAPANLRLSYAASDFAIKAALEKIKIAVHQLR